MQKTRPLDRSPTHETAWADSPGAVGSSSVRPWWLPRRQDFDSAPSLAEIVDRFSFMCHGRRTCGKFDRFLSEETMGD